MRNIVFTADNRGLVYWLPKGNSKEKTQQGKKSAANRGGGEQPRGLLAADAWNYKRSGLGKNRMNLLNKIIPNFFNNLFKKSFQRHQ